MSELKPAVPDVLGEIELDRGAPDFKTNLAAFAKGLEKVIAEFQVDAYVIARKDEGDVMHLVVLPCASAPEERAEAGEVDGAAAAAAEAGVAIASGKTADEIVDSVERIAGRKPSASIGKPGDGLAPGGAGAGVGIRRKR